MRKKIDKIVLYSFAFVAFAIVIAIISSCRTIEKVVEKDHFVHDTTTIYKTRVDSLKLVDSIVIRQKADTVFVEKYKFRDRWRSVHDSIYLSKIDTIRITDKQVITKDETKAAHFLKGSGIAFWVLLVCFIAGWAVKKFIFKH